MFVGIALTAIASGIAAVVALWSCGPEIALLCAPFIGSFVAGATAITVALVRQPKPKPVLSVAVPHRTFAR